LPLQSCRPVGFTSTTTRARGSQLGRGASLHRRTGCGHFLETKPCRALARLASATGSADRAIIVWDSSLVQISPRRTDASSTNKQPHGLRGEFCTKYAPVHHRPLGKRQINLSRKSRTRRQQRVDFPRSARAERPQARRQYRLHFLGTRRHPLDRRVQPTTKRRPGETSPGRVRNNFFV
jgi:hypothetical protein